MTSPEIIYMVIFSQISALDIYFTWICLTVVYYNASVVDVMSQVTCVPNIVDNISHKVKVHNLTVLNYSKKSANINARPQ